MSWKIVFQKGFLGIATFIVAFLAAQPQILTNLIPQNIANMTVGSLIAGGLVALANYLKNKDKK
jgi:hypothetical protein